MKSNITTQNLVCFKMFEVSVTKAFIKSLQLSHLRCKERIWIKQTGNVKCARTQQNLNRSINTATRSRSQFFHLMTLH